MIPWAFLLFAAAFGLILYLHFVLAHQAWRRSRQGSPLEIDRGYVRIEDYFGRSFRMKVNAWLRAAPPGAAERGEIRTSRANERLRTTGPLICPDKSTAQDVLVVQGDFSCGPGCVFPREIYVQGDCRIGPGSQLQALAVDGSLTLGRATTILRWVDSQGDMEIGPGSTIHGRATSRGLVRLGLGARAGSVFGREIRSENCSDEPASQDAGDPPSFLEIPAKAGLEASRLVEMSADTRLYRGDLCPTVPVRVTTKLIVKGDCFFPAGSVLENDVKVTGSLHLGEGSVANGNLVAGQDLSLGPSTRFRGVIRGGKRVRLGAGTRTSGDSGRAAVFAAGTLHLEEDVSLAGAKLASAECVIAGPPGLPVSAAQSRKAQALLAVVLALAALPAAQAQEAEDRSTATLPVRLESGYYARAVSNGFGTWRGTQTQLWLRSSKRFIPALTYDSQSRPTGTQQNYAAFSYMNWTPSFYTTQGISFAPQRDERAIYFPKLRYDVNLHWKLPPSRQVVLKTGFTSFDFGKPGHGQIFNAGALYYRKKLVLDANLFVNRSQPGGLWSASGSVAAQYGREGAYWFGVTAGGGRELYRFTGTAPADLNFKSYTVDMFYRRWISRHVGFVIGAEHGQKLTAYRWLGVRSNLFFEF